MARFPTLESLASAEQDEVLAHWSGLGYYSRARNLHKCAKQVMDDFGGEWPTDVATMEQLAGIGRSTAGAILSLASGVYAPILDGNVKRVLCRFFAVEGWPGNAKVQKTLWQHAEQLTPEVRVADFNQAMMDMGATLCTRSRPNCSECPLADHCQAHQQQATAQYPASKPKKAKPVRSAIFVIAKRANQVLLEKRPATGIWGGLWSLPQFDSDINDVHSWIEQTLNTSSEQIHELDGFVHTFSHFQLNIRPLIIELPEQHSIVNDRQVMDTSPRQWQDLSQLTQLGLPAPVTKLLAQLESNHVQKRLL